MPFIKKSLWMYALALVMGVIGAVAQSEEQTFTVKEITIEGLVEIAEIPVRDQLTFSAGDSITVEDLRNSVQKIYDMGFFRDVQPDIAEEADGVVIAFQLEEFPILQGVEISGNRTYQITWDLIHLKIPFFWEVIKTDKVLELLEKNNVKPFQIANINDISKAAEAIGLIYQEKGYNLFTIDTNQAVNSILRGDILRLPIIEYLVEEVRIIGLEGEYERIAHSLVNLPDDEPILATLLGTNVSALNNSVYFLPDDGSASFLEPVPGSKFDKIVLNFNLQPRVLIDSPTLVNSIDFEGHGAYSQARLHNHLANWDKTVPLDNLGLLSVLKGVFDLYRQSGYTQMDFEVRDEGNGAFLVIITEGMVRNVSVKLNGKTTGYTQINFNPDSDPEIQYFDEDEEGFFYEVDQPTTLTQTYVIQKAMQIHPGDLFNENKLRDTIRTMLNLGYFADVQVDFDINPDTKEVDVILEVFEAEKLGSFNAALSLAEGNLVGTLTLAEKNLFGTGQDISLDYDRGIMGPALTNWSLNYKAFGFFPLYKDFDVRLFQAFERPTFDEELSRMGGEISLTYPLTSTTDLTMGGRHENFEECLRNGVDCKPPGITDSVKFGLINDTRDNPLFPMEGGRRILQIEKAGGFSVGVEFTKVEAVLIHHFFTFDNQNISARLFTGWGESLPSQEKFAFGGPGSLRGGLTSRVSWLAFVNLEYRTKWLDQFSTALFTDWGITGKDALIGTTGLEARVSLPIVGMTRFILAWPVNDPSYKTFVPRFQFSFGTMF